MASGVAAGASGVRSWFASPSEDHD
jgi:hypothetical protein